MSSSPYTSPPPSLDQTSRLLAMLNSASPASFSKPGPLQHSNQLPSAQTSGTASKPRVVSPPMHKVPSGSAASGRPDDHSVHDNAPPSSGSISVQDLLRGLASPAQLAGSLPSGLNPAASPPVSIHRSTSGHQASMLQMLAGGSAQPSRTDVVSSTLGTPVPDAELRPSGASRNKNANLLDLFKTSPSSAVPFPPHQPVIEHPTSPPSASTPPDIPSLPDQASRRTASTSSRSTGNPSAPEAAKSQKTVPSDRSAAPPPTQPPAPLQQSIFQSFSPFDAFGPPPSRSRVASSAAIPSQPAHVLPSNGTAGTDVMSGVIGQGGSNRPIEARTDGLEDGDEAYDEEAEEEEAEEEPDVEAVNGDGKTGHDENTDIRPAENDNFGQASIDPSSTLEPTRAADSEPSNANLGREEDVSVNEQRDTPARKSITPAASPTTGSNAGPSRGPRRLHLGLTSISTSQADPDALVELGTEPRRLSERSSMPRTYSRDSSVAASSVLTAYAVENGAIRIKMRAHAKPGSLHIPATYHMGGKRPVLGLAVSGHLVAIIGADGDIAVVQVPTDWRPTASDKWPPVVGVLDLPFKKEDTHALHKPFKVAWIKRNGRDHLIIAGKKGLVVIDPIEVAREDGQDLGDVVRRHKVLETEGELIDFSVNHAQQAIALLGPKHLTLYNATQLQRVWHRVIPSSDNDLIPSSCQFCETNLIIGRAQDTVLDLLQITQLSVLSTIHINLPDMITHSANRFARPLWDQASGVLWVGVPNRSSLYGFRYALRGQQPIRDDRPGSTVAWNAVAELPVGPVLSVALVPMGSGEKARMVYASTEGTFELEIPDVFDTPKQYAGRTAPEKTDANVVSETSPLRQRKNGSQARGASPSPSKKAHTSSSSPFRTDRESVALAAPGSRRADSPAPTSNGQFQQALQQTEDRLIDHLRGLVQQSTSQLLTRLDSQQSSRDTSREISKRLEASVKAGLADIVQSEMKKTLFPSLVATVQNELRSAKDAAPTAVYAAMKELPREIEKIVAPLVERIVSRTLPDTVEQAVEDAMQRHVLPALSETQASMLERLMEEMRSEMLQIRKELSPVKPSQPLPTESDIQGLTKMMTDLQAQVAHMSEQLGQLAKQPRPSHPEARSSFSVTAPSGPVGPAPRQVSQQRPPNSSSHIPVRSSAELEDIFLSSLSDQNTGSTVNLIDRFSNEIESLFPVPPGRSPLSQAVLLTLLQRVTLALSDLPFYEPPFPRLVRVGHRVADLINPQEPAIAAYIPRLMPVILPTLERTLQRLQHGPPEAQEAARHVGMIAHKLRRTE